jgi:hypothetical protein
MDSDQQERFREAVDRKSAEADMASRRPRREPGDNGIQGSQQDLYEAGQNQDTLSVRDKNSGHGHKTADKWNQ